MRDDFSGLDGLARDLGRTASQADGVVRGALGRTVDKVADEAQTIARSTWRTHTESADRIRGRSARGGRLEAYVFSDGPGGALQERGTVHHPPQPAVGPAFERHRESTLKAEVDKGVDRLLRRRG